MKDIFQKEINKFKLDILNSAILQENLDDIQNLTTVDEVYEILVPPLYNIPIGCLFKRFISNYQEAAAEKESVEFSYVSELYPPASMGVEGSFRHQSPCWFCIECDQCHKRCYVKKDNSQESYTMFMMKLCMSIWMPHVLGFDMDKSNEWYSKNDTWNICEKRDGEYFEMLKNSEIFETKHFVDTQNDSGYVAMKHSLYYFFDLFHKDYNLVVESLTAYIFDIRLQSYNNKKPNSIILDQNTEHEKLGKKLITMTMTMTIQSLKTILMMKTKVMM